MSADYPKRLSREERISLLLSLKSGIHQADKTIDQLIADEQMTPRKGILMENKSNGADAEF